jgi:hypothetical protein
MTTFIGTPVPPITPVATTDSRTLFNAVLRLAREVVLVRDGLATSGSLTTLVDNNAKFPMDVFRGGTLFLLNDTIYRVVTQHSGSIFSFVAVGDSPDAGDPYAVADNDIPLDVLVAAINGAIRNMTIPGEDVSLVTIASQEEYSLPAGVSGLYKVEIASSLTSPYGYTPHYRWDEVNGKLRFSKNSKPGSAGNIIRITYRRQPTDLALEASYIPNDINLDYLHWSAVQIAAKYGARVHGTDPKRDWPAKIQESEVRIQRLASLQPKPQRSPRLSDW